VIPCLEFGLSLQVIQYTLSVFQLEWILSVFHLEWIQHDQVAFRGIFILDFLDYFLQTLSAFIQRHFCEYLVINL